MLINDVVPPKKRTSHGQAALQRVQQLHSATKLSNIVTNPPQLRPELRKYSSFDVLPARGAKKPKRPTLSDIKPQFNHPTAVKATPSVRRATTQLSEPAARSTDRPSQTDEAIPTASSKAAQPALVRPSWRRLLDFAQYPLIAGAAILAASNSTAGQAMIGLFAVFSILVRISSKYTFGAALLLLIGIPFFQALHQSGVSEKCAIYAYELLVVGTLQAIIETWLENRSRKARSAH